MSDFKPNSQEDPSVLSVMPLVSKGPGLQCLSSSHFAELSYKGQAG